MKPGRKIKQKLCKDRISALPEDLLVKVLLLVPTKVAIATATLSRRWRYIWKMLPRLKYMDPYFGRSHKSVWWFLDKSLQLHKAPVLKHLTVSLGSSCPVDVDVARWVEDAVERCIRFLYFNLRWTAEPTSLSKSLYTCKTLKKLTLANKILVDVPSEAFLPSLERLKLYRVVYKDDDSLVMLLSSCPVLKNLFVERADGVNHDNDNVTNFSVKVPSLRLFRYTNYLKYKRGHGGSLVIDSPGLKIFTIKDYSGDSCLIDNMPPCLDMANVDIDSHPSDKFLTSLSSVMYLKLTLMDEVDAICSDINFSRLIECKLNPFLSEYWVQLTMHLLHNSPKLKVLMIDSEDLQEESEDLPLLSSVPGCLSSHLEIFEWKKYRGTREEKKLLTYILANSKCLKTVTISLKFTYNDKEKKKMMMMMMMMMKKKKMMKMMMMKKMMVMKKELKSMYRVSESSQLFFSTQFRWRSTEKHPAFQEMSV